MMSITNICNPTEIPPGKEFAYFNDHTNVDQTVEKTQLAAKITNKGKIWKHNDIKKLLKLADESRKTVDWPAIASQLNRTPSACQSQAAKLNKIIRKIEEHPDSEPHCLRSLDTKVQVIIKSIVQARLAGSTKIYGWTPQQKLKLLELAADDGTDWRTIATRLNKSMNACRVMYSRLMAKGNDATQKLPEPNDGALDETSSHSTDTEVQKIARKTIQENQPIKTIGKKNKRWTAQEKSKLLGLVKEYNKDWEKISSMMNGRTYRACQNTFINLKNSLGHL